MNAASEDIKDIILTLGLGLTFTTDLFIGREPENPDNTVTIFDTPGGRPGLVFEGSDNYFRPSVQIRVRNLDYRGGWSIINNIKLGLHGLHCLTVNNTEYNLINCLSEPSFLDWDSNDRVRFVATFNIQRQ